MIASQPRAENAIAQVAAVAVAAYLLGLGLAGQPFFALHALIALAIVLVGAIIVSMRPSTLGIFLLGFFGVIVTAYAQHTDGYLLGTGIVALGLGALGASSYGRRTAPVLIALVGAAIGAGLFFLGVPSGY
ncbi:MAG TPA: hypothetical protein VGK84_06850 [Candidatus Tumulicola sp.]|jgi:hypothetical protein